MKTSSRIWTTIVPLASTAIMLAACGGGGGSDEPAPPPITVAADWNVIAFTAWSQLEATAGAPIEPHYEARGMAMTSGVILDVLNAIDRRNEPYAYDAKQPGASPDAAVAQAAHDVMVADPQLISDFPSGSQKAYLDTALAADLARVPDGAAKTAGITLGHAAATFYIAMRSSDAAHMAPYGPSPKGNGTTWGQYQYTAPFNSPGAPFFGGVIGVPDWQSMTPFVLKSVTQFTLPGPYPSMSADDMADIAEVKAIGGADSTTRTAEQTQIADFFKENSPLMWNRIARNVAIDQSLDGWQQARLFALLNLAMCDTYIVYADAGNTWNHWRPVTAIHAADPTSTWQEYGFPTPPTRDYTSGHSMEGGAAAAVLQSVFATDTIAFSTTSSSLAGVSRDYRSFSSASDENAMSRIYIGYHFRKATVDGKAIGTSIGSYVASAVAAPVAR